MHILLMPSWYKTKKEPFMGTFFEEQARALLKINYHAGILFAEYLPFSALFGKVNLENDFYDDNGLPTFIFSMRTNIPKFRRLSYQSFCREVEKIFLAYVDKHGKPDVIHAHSVFYGGIAARYIAEKHRIPLVITEHLTSFIMGTISNEHDRSLAREIFKNADAALIVSRNFKRDLEIELELPDNVFQVVHNMVADLFFENFEPKAYQPGEPFVLFTNSFLLPRKNHKLIFDTMQVLKEKKINFMLRVGGDGPLRNDLERYAVQCGIEDQVVFLGGLKRSQVKEEINKSHAFLLASFYETFGVVLIECLASGRPVITTDSGGPRDFVDASNGIIVNEFSAIKLAHAIEVVASSYHRYDQKAISKRCREQFSEEKIAGQLAAVYHKVCAKEGSVQML